MGNNPEVDDNFCHAVQGMIQMHQGRDDGMRSKITTVFMAH
jgi:hypothetical protein